MNEIPISDFRKKSSADLAAACPAVVTSDSVPMFIIGTIGQVISLEGIHERMKQKILNLEKIARAGQPTTVMFIPSKDD